MGTPTLEKAAYDLLRANQRRGRCAWNQKEYAFVCPSPETYPYQWFWDSCFHAIVLCRLDPDLAKAELKTLLNAALPSGFIPHLVFWESTGKDTFLAENFVGRTTSNYSATIQPPMIAYAVERVYEATGDEAFLRDALPGLQAYYRWLMTNRDPDGDGLIAILQPEESGMDCSPKYDVDLRLDMPSHDSFLNALSALYEAYEPLRGDDIEMLNADLFHVEDVLVNAVYALGLRALGRMLEGRGDPAEFYREADRCRDALLAKCWDEEVGAFFDLSGISERRVPVLTVSALMPLILDGLPPSVVRRLVEDLLMSPNHFWLPYPVPSVSASEPLFEPGDLGGFIWRGPSWMCTNWFLCLGLRKYGYGDVADEIAARSRRLVENAGFREYYDPYTGAGAGAEQFAWSTLVLDM